MNEQRHHTTNLLLLLRLLLLLHLLLNLLLAALEGSEQLGEDRGALGPLLLLGLLGLSSRSASATSTGVSSNYDSRAWSREQPQRRARWQRLRWQAQWQRRAPLRENEIRVRRPYHKCVTRRAKGYTPRAWPPPRGLQQREQRPPRPWAPQRQERRQARRREPRWA
ncbi:hypothetical protein BDW22DRAFT_265936 [Trametopsis cervina]|nr:hypothetical protein BDW22DRAFT_265936 [Trametopsis cervina]